MRLILTTVAATALVAGAALPALAHGGAYRPPGGEIPGDTRPPEDPPPPPDETGPGTPGGEEGGNPGTPGGEVGGGGGETGEGGGGTGGGGGENPPPGGGEPGGGVTTGRAKPKAAGYADWIFWWNYNKDALLELKRHIKERQSTAGTGTGIQAFGVNASTGSILTATDARIRTDIVPVLRAIMAADPKDVDSDIQSAAELALAKIGDPEVVPKLMEISANEKRVYDKIAVESASLAFGLLQKDTPDIREFLIALTADADRNAGFARPFAAVSLGLLGDKSDKDGVVGQALLGVIERRETGKDVKPAAILALGLLENPRYAEALLRMAKAQKGKGAAELSDMERAHAISSLGRIGRAGLDRAGEETAVLDALVALVTDEKQRDDAAPNALRSASIALGQIGAKCGDLKLQKKVLGTLRFVVAEAKDDQERHFALIAIGRLGAAPGVETKLREDCIDALRHGLDKGRQLTPTYAALGLGLIGKSMVDRGVPMDDERMRRPVREMFRTTKDPRTRGAFAVASGLLRDLEAVGALRGVLAEKAADAKLRGYAVLSLGMIGTDAAREDIRRILREETEKELRVHAAIAAGLLADSTVIPDLLAVLKDRNESQYVLGSVALALGQLGDERAITPLVAIANDARTYPSITRALAIVALGQIGDRRDVPVLSRVSTDINYRDQAAYEVELLTIL